MGVGKTRIAIQHLQKNFNQFIEVLVVVPKHSVTQSWLYELDKMGLSPLVEHITFTTYLSLKKKDPNDYDIVYLDECHSLLDSHREFLNNYNGKILGLTGKPPKYHKSEKGRLVNQFCPIIYEFVTDSAVDNNILNH